MERDERTGERGEEVQGERGIYGTLKDSLDPSDEWE